MATETHYEALGIPESASPELIRRAYFRLVRVHGPQGDPEAYQRLNEAREVLSDPRRRGAYDQELRSGGRIRALIDQAALCADADPQKAMGLLKSAVAIAPDIPRTRALLAHVLMRMKEYPLAEKQYRWLLKVTPHDERLYCQLANCLWRQDRDDAAEEALRKALALNAAYHDAMLLQARIFREAGRTVELVAALERAIANDGVENFADFNALLQLALVHAQQVDPASAEAAVRRLLAVVTPAKAAAAAEAILRLGQTLCDQGRYDDAGFLLGRLAAPPLTEDGQAEVALLAKKARLAQQGRQMAADTLLEGGLAICFGTLYVDQGPEAVREARMDEAFVLLRREQDTKPRALIQRIEYIRREYPEVAADQAAFLEQLHVRAQERADRLETLEREKATMAVAPAPPPTPTGLGRFLPRFRR
jgi:tetratricopeptide (TPR) repeat protein